MIPSRLTPKTIKKRKLGPNLSLSTNSHSASQLNTTYRATQNIKTYTTRYKSLDPQPETTMKAYIQYTKIQKEIETFFPKITLNAYIDRTNWQLVIKTSSQKDHEELQSTKSLPKAFKSGIELIEKIKKFYAAIHHIDTDIDLNKTEYKAVRENHGIIEIKRLTTKTGDSLKTVKIVIEDQTKFTNLLSKGEIQILGCIVKPITEWIFKERPNQCFNCQSFGHSSKACKHTHPTCLRCSGNHDHKSCKVDPKAGNNYRRDAGRSVNMQGQWSSRPRQHHQQHAKTLPTKHTETLPLYI